MEQDNKNAFVFRPADGLEIREPTNMKDAEDVYNNMRDEDRQDMPGTEIGWEVRLGQARRSFSIIVRGRLIGIGAIWDYDGIRLLTVTQKKSHRPDVSLRAARVMPEFFQWVADSDGDGSPFVIMIPPDRKVIKMMELAGCVVRGSVGRFVMMDLGVKCCGKEVDHV